MSTKGSGGKRLKKKVTVLTDDPDNGKIPLTITGKVFSVYTLSDRRVKLTGVAGEKIVKTITVTPSKKYPFTVQSVTAKKGGNIRFQLKETKNGDTVQYALIVENRADGPKTYFDTLYLKTDSEIRPEISITVLGNIKAATTESP